MHRLFALSRLPDEAQADARRAYAAAWIILLAALLVGPAAAFLNPGHAGPWLLATAAVAAACFMTIAIILHGSLRRSRLEAQLRQVRELDSLGRMAGRMAHDFNNLLTVINGYSGLLLSRTEAGDSIHADLQAIREAGERAASLVRQLITVSGRQAAQPRALDLNAIVSGSQATLESLIGADIKLTIALEPALGCVMADPGQIRQVLTNLALNARDAMPGGGKLSIEAANINRDYVQLTVSDTGTGMSEDVMSHIFEPFFTTKPAAFGAGLGLAEVYGIVKQNGGHISVSSKAGRGAAFKIYLPRVPAPPAPSAPDAVDSPDARETYAEPETGGLAVLIGA